MAQSTLGTVKGVYIDLETGGLDPNICGITEVAMAAFEIDLPIPGKQATACRITSRYQTYVKPQEWLVYAPGALAMQSYPGRQITLEFLETYGKTEARVVLDMQRFLGVHIYPNAKYWNAQMWAQNADFDHGFTSKMHQRVLAEDPTVGPLFAKRCDWSCTRKLFTKLGAMIYANNCQCGAISQKDIMPFYNLPQAQTHTALQDCIDGVTCLSKMLEDEANYYAQLYKLIEVPK